MQVIYILNKNTKIWNMNELFFYLRFEEKKTIKKI